MGKKRDKESNELVYNYPRQDSEVPEEGWVLLELRHCLWNFANLQLVFRTNDAVDRVVRKVQNECGRVEEVLLYVGEYAQEHNRIKDTGITIGDLLQTFGNPDKSSPEKYLMYYDFTPFSPKEPVLLSLN